MLTSRPLAFALPPLALAAALLTPGEARAYGESIDSFPSWAERVMHAWANRARVDPQIEMAACGNNCSEAACYSAKGPLYWDEKLNHAARFHAANMAAIGFFAHDSKCTIVPDIGSLYPGSCDGAAACACVGGKAECSPKCSSFSERVSLFGVNPSGEIIASTSDPDQSFYLWLFEKSTGNECAFSLENGHRWLLLTGGPSVGFGTAQTSVGDFGGAEGTYKIPSGSHYPRQADSVEAWANWSDGAGPQLAAVNVDGACSPMSLQRGKPENGAYKADVAGVGSGCHRYYFLFKDSMGQKVTYPEAGSLGIGAPDCADWDATRPAEGAGCDCTPACNGAQCGDDGCGGTCGTCEDGEGCQGGMCVPGGQGGSGNGPASSGAGPASGGGNGNSDDGGDDEGCACRSAGLGIGSGGGGAGLFALLAAPLLAALRRRGARRGRSIQPH